MISTIILTKDNMYLDSEGNLPSRSCVSFDKDLLRGMVKGLNVSKKGFDTLPNSIKSEVFCDGREPTAAITIPEISALSDILLVVKSCEVFTSGKVFRLDGFERIYKSKDVNLYKRITNEL